MNFIKNHKKKLLGLLVTTVAAASLYGINQKTGQEFQPNKLDVPSITDPLNSRVINFPCADQDNTGETVIIKMDNCNYQIFDNQDGYVSLTNISPVDQNYEIRVLDSNGAQVKNFEEFKPKQPYLVDVPDYAPVDTCKKSKDPSGEDTQVCGYQTGTHQETRYRDEWGGITKNPNPTNDPNVPTKFKKAGQFQFWIPTGATKYFKLNLKAPLKTEGKFYITAKGSLGSFGDIDPSWYSNSWLYRKAITIDHTKISGSNSNFPVLISTTTPEFKFSGGHMGKSDGTDMLFTDSDGTTKLNHEIERYSSTTGETIAWVKYPGTLSTSVDTVLYMYYGNAAAADQQNVTGTWDSNFTAIYHVPDGTTLGLNDSTGLTTVTNHGATATTGKIDGAAATPWVDAGATQNFTTSDFSLEAWFNATSLAGGPVLFYKGVFNTNGYYVQLNNSSNNIAVVINQSGAAQSTRIPVSSITTGVSYHFVFTRTGTVGRIYLNGADLTSTQPSITNPLTSSDNFQIGAYSGAANQLSAMVDEVRVSNAARSAGWIVTEYNNQNSPGTFETFGTEENAPVSSVGVGRTNINGANGTVIINGATGGVKIQ